jgi:hypothetical protein
LSCESRGEGTREKRKKLTKLLIMKKKEREIEFQAKLSLQKKIEEDEKRIKFLHK